MWRKGSWYLTKRCSPEKKKKDVKKIGVASTGKQYTINISVMVKGLG